MKTTQERVDSILAKVAQRQTELLHMQEQSPYAANAHATRRPPKTQDLGLSFLGCRRAGSGEGSLYNLLLNAGGGADTKALTLSRMPVAPKAQG